MAHLSMVKNSGKVHVKRFKSAFPVFKGTLTVAGTACGGVVVKITEKKLTVFVKLLQVLDIVYCRFHFLPSDF
jgi:hypothetical protein